MNSAFPFKQNRALKVQTVKQITGKTAVTITRIGSVKADRIWSEDLQDAPEVARPSASRVFATATVADQQLRREIATKIVDVVVSRGDQRFGEVCA